MALEHEILVSLAEQPATGYDLARRFDASIGNFWQASHQQIYRVLARMGTDNWVEVKTVTQDGRPTKKIYAINDVGHHALREWLTTPTPAEAFRSEFAVKLRALHLADRVAIVSDVTQRRDRHAATLQRYEASRSKHFPDPNAIPEQWWGAYLVLRGGIRAEQVGLDWCDEILSYLAAR